MGRSIITASAVAVLGLLAACGDDDDTTSDDTPTTAAAEDQTTTSSTSATTSSTEGTAPARDSGSASDDGPIQAADGVVTDGTWAVGEAGTIEFRVDGGLTLVGVVEAEGWTSRVEVDDGEEIEVDFRRDGEEIDIEVEYEGGVLEIEIHHDIDGAEPGAFELGPAGTATIAVSGDSATLADLTVSDGWDVTEQDTSDGEVEIDLRQGNVSWELDAEIDEGRLEVDTHFKIEGRYP